VKITSEDVACRARKAKVTATPEQIANPPATIESAQAEFVMRNLATRASAALSAVARRIVMRPKYWLCFAVLAAGRFCHPRRTT
jgi:hypothetical protein